MESNCFRFRQFSIKHDKTAMRVGTDGVLLGAWCDTNTARRILDIGTGSGLIAIMLAQRSDAYITGIEIDESAAIQAKENANNSPWKNRVEIIKCDIRKFYTNDKYDLIVSNPPFFENNKTAEHNCRNIARQTLTLTHTELLESASRLLTEQGSLAVILPEQATEKFIYLAWEKGIRLVHRTDVLTIPGKLPKRALLQFSRKRTEPERSDTLTLCDAYGNKTLEYSMLTKDFYL